MSPPLTSVTPAFEMTPRQTVEQFIALAEARAWDDAIALLGENIAYTNVSLPTLRGRRLVGRVLTVVLDHEWLQFEVYIHTCAADGATVLTDRTDAVTIGRFRVQFWVCGRFEVHDGRIYVWRDSFDWAALLGATLRGVVGVAIPAVRARTPAREHREGRSGRAVAPVRQAIAARRQLMVHR